MTNAGVAELERLRAAYRPKRVEVLLIGESPPDPSDGELRFFYAPGLRVDNSTGLSLKPCTASILTR